MNITYKEKSIPDIIKKINVNDIKLVDYKFDKAKLNINLKYTGKDNDIFKIWGEKTDVYVEQLTQSIIESKLTKTLDSAKIHVYVIEKQDMNYEFNSSDLTNNGKSDYYAYRVGI